LKEKLALWPPISRRHFSYYPPPASLMFAGLLGGFQSHQLSGTDRALFPPAVRPGPNSAGLVHGLFSTPFDWVKTINGLQADPEIRKHYQFWIFAYPTAIHSSIPHCGYGKNWPRPINCIPTTSRTSWSATAWAAMLTHDQVVTVNEGMWEKALGQNAGAFSRKIPGIV